MIHQHEAHRCCVYGCPGLAAWGYFLPERPGRGTWWACADHRSEAQRRRDATRGSRPKVPAGPTAGQDSLFGKGR